MTKFIKPFRTGDEVRIQGKNHIINEVKIQDMNNYEYSTNRSAWHHHSDCSLVRECNITSMKLLVQDLEDGWE